MSDSQSTFARTLPWLVSWYRRMGPSIESSLPSVVACFAFWLLLVQVAKLLWWLPASSVSAPATLALPVNLASVAAPTVARSSAVDLATLQSLHLFGERLTLPALTVEPALNVLEAEAVETRLALTLVGVAVSSDPAQALAMVIHQQQQQSYRVGQRLEVPGHVVLVKVMADRILLDNAGQYEVLWLYQEQRDQAAPAGVQQLTRLPAVTDVVDQRQNPQLRALVRQYRDQLYQDPARLAEVVRVSPVRDRQGLTGYQLQPGPQRQVFQQLGLQAGDQIVAINGQSLEEPARIIALYRELKDATEASFTLLRGDEVLEIQVALDE